jgi:hypothetical protein
MDIELSQQESAVIRQALDSYCSDLRMEIVDTDNPAFRRGLKEERALIEGVLAKLDDAIATEPDRSPEGHVMVRLVAWYS